jgi:hypothetical protein
MGVGNVEAFKLALSRLIVADPEPTREQREFADRTPLN